MKLKDMIQLGQMIGANMFEQAKEFRDTTKPEDYKRVFFEKAISMTEFAKAALVELAEKNGVDLDPPEIKKPVRKKKS